MRPRLPRTILVWLPLAAALACAAAPAARASPKALAAGTRYLAAGKLVDVLTLLRKDEGNVARGEERAAAKLLADAAFKAVDKQRPELALQLAEASFELDPAQPPMLALLGTWALEDGHVAQARRYAEFWVGVAPGDEQARAFQEKARAATPASQGRLATLLGGLLPKKGAPARARGSGEVVLYGTAWCTYCKRGKAWLKDKGIAFVEKDVEEDPAARAELTRKAAEQGFHQRGVPVLDARGTLESGFNPARWEQLLQ